MRAINKTAKEDRYAIMYEGLLMPENICGPTIKAAIIPTTIINHTNIPQSPSAARKDFLNAETESVKISPKDLFIDKTSLKKQLQRNYIKNIWCRITSLGKYEIINGNISEKISEQNPNILIYKRLK